MNTKMNITWNQYALIVEMTKRLDDVSPQFGKTVLQKLVFLLQKIYGIDCGYDFKLYSYGPFDSQLLNDLDLVVHWGCISIETVNAGFGGYRIRPSSKANFLLEKAADFLNDQNTQRALNHMVETYGPMRARDLELRATTVYVERDLRNKDEKPTKEQLCRLVGHIKPKFNKLEIEKAIDELIERRHIQLGV